MIPESLLKFNCTQGVVIPRYLDERDHSWIRLLTEEYLRFVGSRKIELIEHLKRPLPFISPKGKRALTMQVLNNLFSAEIKSPVPPKKLRLALFEEASTSLITRKATLQKVATEFNIDVNALEASLFCDLPNERRIKKPDIELHPGLIALKANALLIQSFLSRSLTVTIQLEGNARIVVRQAKLRGLICELPERSGKDSTRLVISGPFVLFRRTFMYGRALGELLPQLIWCNRFQLKARCIIGEKESILEVSSGDPIFPSKTPKQFDSKVEETFARRFLKTFKDWDLIREPEPISAGGTFIFPDFLLRKKDSPGKFFLLEIVGFWTPDYLEQKIGKLKKANLNNFILCVDSSLNCSNEDFPKEAHLIRFKKNIDLESIRPLIEKNEL